jgi:hypothetical protein
MTKAGCLKCQREDVHAQLNPEERHQDQTTEAQMRRGAQTNTEVSRQEQLTDNERREQDYIHVLKMVDIHA